MKKYRASLAYLVTDEIKKKRRNEIVLIFFFNIEVKFAINVKTRQFWNVRKKPESMHIMIKMSYICWCDSNMRTKRVCEDDA